jgi:LPS-assembly lipoprotein
MINFFKITILTTLSVSLLAGCGFSPLYGQNPENKKNSVGQQISQIAIDIIPDREGQLLRNTLIDHLYQSGYPQNPIATLKVSKIIEKRTDLDLTKTSDTTRSQLWLQSTMTLTNNQGTILLTRSIQSVVSFNVLGSEFATRVTEQAARESALNDLARQIELNLSLFYSAK